MNDERRTRLSSMAHEELIEFCINVELALSRNLHYVERLRRRINYIEFENITLQNVLIKMVNQHCKMKDGSLDSFAITSNMEAIELLEDLGYVDIKQCAGRRVIAYWLPLRRVKYIEKEEAES